MTPEDAAMMAEMQAEMAAISAKSSDSRFDTYEKKVVATTSTPSADGTDSSNSNTVEFLRGNPEDPALNQYWYSQPSVEAIASEVSRLINLNGPSFTVAFLSTPSIYFALPEEQRKQCWVFDYDDKWADDRGFVHYDFNTPDTFVKKTGDEEGEFGENLKGSFSLAVIDPPFITVEVWRQYASTATSLLSTSPLSPSPSSGLIIGTTVAENKPFMRTLLKCTPQKFKPSIPNLVYQYNSYANFEGAVFLGVVNPEIPVDE